MAFSLLVAVIVTLLCQPQAQASGDMGGKITIPGTYTQLISKARSEGSVRVILRVSVPFAAEPTLAQEEVESQRTAIKAAQSRVLADLAAAGLQPLSSYQYLYSPYLAMTVDAATLDTLLASPMVTRIQEDMPVPAAAVNYSIPLIGANKLHAQGKTGTGFTVAVLDTGVDKEHPYLRGSVVSEACYSTNYAPQYASSLCPGQVTDSTETGSAMPYKGNCPFGDCDHGTHVAGIVAGRNIAGGPGPGVAPGTKLIAIQVFTLIDNIDLCGSAGMASPCVTSYPSDQKKALERVYALRDTHKIAAVNMSLGGGRFAENCDDNALKESIDNLRAANIATIICSQNQGWCGEISSPACISSAISVGSTDRNDAVAAYSNSASFLTLLAPGTDINSAIPGGRYRPDSGTSMATPQVAGAWALMRQAKPKSTVDSILAAFTTTGKDVADTGKCPEVTKRRINVFEASKDMDVLTVNRSGPGTVTSNPAGIDCGKACASAFHTGTKVTLNATATTGAVFEGWSGACTGTGICELTMDKAQTVRAVFRADHMHILSVTKQLPQWGKVASNPPGIDCGADCRESFPAQSTVILTAVPARGYAFVRWTGRPCQQAGPSCEFAMESNYIIRAVFTTTTGSSE